MSEHIQLNATFASLHKWSDLNLNLFPEIVTSLSIRSSPYRIPLSSNFGMVLLTVEPLSFDLEHKNELLGLFSTVLTNATPPKTYA